MDTHSIAIIVTNLAAIIGVGVALAGLMLRQGARLDRRIDGLQEQNNAMQEQMNQRFEAMQEQMNQRFDAMQEQMNQRFEAMKDQIADLRERVARIEGMLTRQPASAEEAVRAQVGS